ncbi:hypothetical protein [Methanohalobium sp.]|uniref:hypothetical protein n=1 Tax=Methanohalobium sp. TaxID=2837493 RepID=UPI0025D43AB7|nr:hypothetical protein [Methanohalobium sp.]
MLKASANARKSKGEYKPLIVFTDDQRVSFKKTEVVETSEKRIGVNTKNGFVAGDRYARGTTYKTRKEAVQAAQAEINNRYQTYKANYDNLVSDKRPQRHLDYVLAQMNIYA